MRQRTRFAFVTFAWALASAFGAVKAASAMGALPDQRLTAIAVGTYPDCIADNTRYCVGTVPSYCWLDDSNPNDKRCKRAWYYTYMHCEADCGGPGACDGEEDCWPCQEILDCGRLPDDGKCQPGPCDNCWPHKWFGSHNCGYGTPCYE